MTRGAVVDKLDEYIHTVAIQAIDELEPSRVMDVDLPGDTIKSAMRDDIRQEMIGIKSSFSDQCLHMVEYAEADDEDELDRFVEEFLRVDVFYDNFVGSPEDGRAFQDDLREYFVRGSGVLAPLVVSGTDDFWESFTEQYDGEDDVDAFLDVFRRADVVAPYADDLRITMALDTGLPLDEVEYTAEAIRVFEEAERYLREIIRAEADEAFAD